MTGDQVFYLLILVVVLWFGSGVYDTYQRYVDTAGRIKTQQELNNIVKTRLDLLIDVSNAQSAAIVDLHKRLDEIIADKNCTSTLK